MTGTSIEPGPKQRRFFNGDYSASAFSPNGAAKFWLEPQIALAVNKGLGATELNEL